MLSLGPSPRLLQGPPDVGSSLGWAGKGPQRCVVEGIRKMDKKTRKKKKVVKAVEKAVKRAVKKGVTGQIVEAAVERVMTKVDRDKIGQPTAKPKSIKAVGKRRSTRV